MYSQIAYHLIEEQRRQKRSQDGHISFVGLLADRRYCGTTAFGHFCNNAAVYFSYNIHHVICFVSHATSLLPFACGSKFNL